MTVAPTAGDISTEWRRARVTAILFQAAVIAGLMSWLYWHELKRLVDVWQTQSNWSHGFVVPLFSLYFIYAHRDQLLATRARPSWLGLPIILMGLWMFAAAIYQWRMGYPKALSIVITIFGTVLFTCGWRVMRIVWLPIIYLIFALPLPEDKYVQLTMPLRRLASAVAAIVLRALPDVDTQLSGVTIDLFRHGELIASLNVADACSGMRVMIGLCALGVAIAYLGERPTWQRVTLVLMCVPIAIFTNLLRVTATGIFHVFEWKALTQNAGHAAWGLVMYAVALAFFYLLSFILSHLVVDDAEAGGTGPLAAEPTTD